jgi:outer membrane protein assembly factor BamB
MSPKRPRVRRWLLIGGGAGLIIVLAAVGAFLLSTRQKDVYNPGVRFRTEPPPPPAPEPSPARPDTDPFTWAVYGYTKDRRGYLPASTLLRPPYARLWSHGVGVLLEFTPVLGGRSLYVLDNKGVVHAIARRRGRVRWTRRLGTLAASSPAYSAGRIFATLLKGRRGGGRVVALSARTGRILWSRSLPSRTESSPLVDHGRLYFGSEDGTVYALRASDGAVRWTFRARGPVKAGLALSDGKLYFGDYAGRLYALRRRDGHAVWQVATRGAALGLRAGQFYATPAVAYGRVYVGNTDGYVYSYDADRGRLAGRRKTADYVYSAAAVAQVPGGRPTVYVGSYDGTLYALDARSGRVRWRYRDGGNISGAATVVGDIVYFANVRHRTVTGLGARTGRRVFRFGHGAFSPVVSDGRMIFLTGSTSIYGLRPRRAHAHRTRTAARGGVARRHADARRRGAGAR